MYYFDNKIIADNSPSTVEVICDFVKLVCHMPLTDKTKKRGVKESKIFKGWFQNN